MSVTNISSLAARETLRASVARAQVEVDQVAGEVSGGRHHDVGLVLGASTSRVLDLRQLSGEIEGLGSSNAMLSSRLQSVQAAMAEMQDLANGLLASAAIAQSRDSERSLFIEDARSKMGTLMSLLSTTSGGAYLFGGTNSSVAPVNDYLAEPPGTGRATVVAAFASEFGFPPDDPQAAAIQPAAMDAYLNGTFAQLFADPQWQATFSTAGEAPMRSRIAPGEIVEMPVTANSSGIRGLVSALSAVIDSSAGTLNAAAFASLASHVAKSAGEAAAELADMQSTAGIVQERVTRAGERLALQRTVLEKAVGELEAVDVAEASTRLTLLMTKLETSYALTARLQKLSLLTYL